jgi:hypothetical protein
MGQLKWYSDGLQVGWLGIDSRQEQEIFLFYTVSRTALGPTLPSIKWLLAVLSLGVKQLMCEADHSPLSSAEVKNGEAMPPPL